MPTATPERRPATSRLRRLPLRAAGAALLGAALASAAACRSDHITNPNIYDPNQLAKQAGAIGLAVNGILETQRGNLVNFDFETGIFGREAWDYFATDSRSVTDYLKGLSGAVRALDPAGFASGLFASYYTDMRNILLLEQAVDNSPALSTEQKAATKGLADTFHALDVLYLLETRDSLGTPVVVDADPLKLTPFVSRDAAFQFVLATLNQGKTELQAGGAAFPFSLPATFANTFTSYNTPAGFLKFNRMIFARAAVEFGALGYPNSGSHCPTCLTDALAAIDEAGTPPLGSSLVTQLLYAGPYLPFSSSANDATNAFNNDPEIVAHNSEVADAKQQPNGDPDLRVQEKLALLVSPRSAPPGTDMAPNATPPIKQPTAFYNFGGMYPTPTTPIPIIRIEEMILLRAEINFLKGNYADMLTDINTIRTTSGGLAPIASVAALTAPHAAGESAQDAALDELLYEKRYSLMAEGRRWVDYRLFGRLNTLPLDQPNQFVARVMPIPTAECLARHNQAPGCS